MSKYSVLWIYIQQNENPTVVLTFEEIHAILGITIDHSFLNYEKELLEFGYRVGKISLTEHTVSFIRSNK